MAGTMKDRFYGLYRGIVLDNKDPENQGRLKVAVPNVYGNDDSTGEALPSKWALPKWAMCGMNWGFQMIPPVKNPDGSPVYVWIEFESGDQKCPVWSGGFIQPNHLYQPMNGLLLEKPYTACCLVTPQGNRIFIDDNDETGTFELVDKYGNSIVMNKDGITITDCNQNKTIMDDKGIQSADKNGNVNTMDDNGIVSSDKNGNTTTMDDSGIISSDKNGNIINMSQNGVTETDKAGNTTNTVSQGAGGMISKVIKGMIIGYLSDFMDDISKQLDGLNQLVESADSIKEFASNLGKNKDALKDIAAGNLDTDKVNELKTQYGDVGFLNDLASGSYPELAGKLGDGSYDQIMQGIGTGELSDVMSSINSGEINSMIDDLKSGAMGSVLSGIGSGAQQQVDKYGNTFITDQNGITFIDCNMNMIQMGKQGITFTNNSNVISMVGGNTITITNGSKFVNILPAGVFINQ